MLYQDFSLVFRLVFFTYVIFGLEEILIPISYPAEVREYMK